MHSQKPKQSEKVHYVASTTFTLDRNYDDLKAIGKGSYGVVCSAFSVAMGEKVAIKKITPMSKQVHDAKHVLREIKLMRHMGKHENVITLYDLCIRETSDELYIVMELLDSDLHRILQSKQPLTENHFRHFFHQLLCGVKYLHDNRIIHRDLKPGNLLVSKDCRLRITDFGLAREKPHGKSGQGEENSDEAMTEHVVTRWYRPPELMLVPDGFYDYAIDMWSCGCILAEMFGRHPLFPGKNFVHQLTLVFDVIGCPTPKEYKHVVNHEALKFLHAQGNKQRTSFRELYPTMSSDGTDMLEAILLFNPAKRVTVDEALKMPYMLGGVGIPASLDFPPISAEFEFSFEHNPHVTRYQLRQMISAEVASFKKEMKHKQGGGGSGGSSAENSRPSSTRTNGAATAADSHNQQQTEVFSKESSSHTGSSAATKVDAKKETTAPTATATTAGDKRSVSAPRLRGANGSGAQAAAAAAAIPEPSNTAAAAAAAQTGSRRISMKPPVFYQQPKKNTLSSTITTTATAAAVVTDHKLSSSQGIAQQQHHHPAHSEDEEDESDSDAYDKLFQTRSTVAASRSGSTSAVSSKAGAGATAISAPPSSSVSAVMERIAKIVDSASQPSSLPTPTSTATAGPKSPARSLRYQPSSDLGPLPEKTGFEYKSMDLEDMLRSSAAKSGAVRTSIAANDTVVPTGLSGGLVVAAAAAGAASPGRRSIMDTYLSPRRIMLNKDNNTSSSSGLRAHSGDRDDGPSGGLPRSSVAMSPPAPAAPTASTATAGGSSRGTGPLYDSLLGRFEDKFNLSNRFHQVDREAAAAAAEKPRVSSTFDGSSVGSVSQLKSSVLPSPPKAQHSSAGMRSSYNDTRRSESKHADEEKHRDESDADDDSGSEDIEAARRLLREYSQPLRQKEQQQREQQQHLQRLSAAQVAAELLRDRPDHGHTASRKADDRHHQQPQQQQSAHNHHEYSLRRGVVNHTEDDEEQEEDERDNRGGKEQKKKFTVARSPKFSTMSWQRRGSEGGAAGGGDKKRPNSTMRNVSSTANLDNNEYESTMKGAAAAAAAAPPAPPAKPVKIPSYAIPTASQMLKTNNPVRSESAHRMRK